MATIEIDGKKYDAAAGSMVIEVADENGIHIPRFCYHKKLSVAANCRMCLVEVEKSGKPLPACATPVTDGMKVFTKSKKALDAQKIVMEFLLINHPLDCPICDQGGECELQDVSMGYGDDVSRYTEGKRVVDDEDIGPLVSTDMTRCIHCTRCVRFGEEVSGAPELGATGRGENMRIGTFVKHAMTSEVAANVIDLCPVGALTNKPFRFTARAWELTQHPTVAVHDCIGTNIYAHTRRGEVMRVVPRENENLNETWCADRDRFGLLGTKSEQRLASPRIKQNGEWRDASWQEILPLVAEKLDGVIAKHGAETIATIVSPNSTTEECYLAQKLMRAIGSPHIDHRAQQQDFADQDSLGVAPIWSMPYAELENCDAICLVGSNIQREQPLAGLKVRKAALNDAQVIAINPIDYDFKFPLASKTICQPAALIDQLAQIAKALTDGATVSNEIASLLADCKPSSAAIEQAKILQQANSPCILLGALAMNHPQASVLRSLARLIAELCQGHCVLMTNGANAAGAWFAGAIPHREAAGTDVKQAGKAATEMFANHAIKAYLLHGIEPELDCAFPSRVTKALERAELVVMLTPYVTDEMLQYADVLLPTAPFTETSGTYVSLDGNWQTVKACTQPYAESRPAWKVFRVLGNLMECDGFEFTDSQQVLVELQQAMQSIGEAKAELKLPGNLPSGAETNNLQRITEWPIYRTDATVRRSKPLQDTPINFAAAAWINQVTADKLNLNGVKQVAVTQGDTSVGLPLQIDNRIADNCVYIPAGFIACSQLGESFGSLQITAA